MSEDAKHTALYEWGKIRNRNRPRAPSMAETVAFGEGFDAAMKFMASPRIPAPAIPKPLCPRCGITFRQRHLAANREVTCSACGHQYQDPT